MEIDLFKRLAKLPYILDGELLEGKKLAQNKHCQKCKERTCLELNESLKSEHICKFGFNSFLLKLKNRTVILNGLITEDNKIIKKGRKEARKSHEISREDVNSFIEEISFISGCVDDGIKANIRDRFSLFHDVKSSYGVAFANVESLIFESNGSNFYEKLQNSNQKVIDLYDSLELVNSQLDLIDVMVNPAAIVQGSKRELNLYKWSDKLSKLFQPKADKKGIRISIMGDNRIVDGSYHESIKLIPVILIENAIKYSNKDSQLLLKFSCLDKIKLEVSSYGKPVPEDERELIFEKQIRGSNTKDYTDVGIGMGLYTARNILAKHLGKIWYDYEPRNERFGFNKFIVEL